MATAHMRNDLPAMELVYLLSALSSKLYIQDSIYIQVCMICSIDAGLVGSWDPVVAGVERIIFFYHI